MEGPQETLCGLVQLQSGLYFPTVTVICGDAPPSRSDTMVESRGPLNVCGLQGGPAKEWEHGAGSAILVQSSVVVSSRLGHVHVLRVHRDDRMLGTRRKMVIWIYTLILSPSLQIR